MVLIVSSKRLIWTEKYQEIYMIVLKVISIDILSHSWYTKFKNHFLHYN